MTILPARQREPNEYDYQHQDKCNTRIPALAAAMFNIRRPILRSSVLDVNLRMLNVQAFKPLAFPSLSKLSRLQGLRTAPNLQIPPSLEPLSLVQWMFTGLGLAP